MRDLLCVLSVIASVQDNADRNLQQLIEDLRSDRLEVRERASRELIEIGVAARSAVEGLLKDQDPELQYRARVVVAEIDRREQIRNFRIPGKRITVQLKNATLDDAVGAVLGPFGLDYEIRDAGTDLRITAVTLNLVDCLFWEAVDELARVAGVDVLGRSLTFASRGCHALSIEPVLRRPFRWETIGDMRIVAGPLVMGGGGANHGDLTARLLVIVPPWAVPDHIRVESVKIAGKPIAEEGRGATPRGAPPRDSKKLTVCEVWRGKDGVSRKSLEGATAVTLEGTLVVTVPGREAKEIRAPFAIRELAVPPIPER